MSEATTHTGSCHCGKVRYEATIDLATSPVISCNCSMCARKGTLLTFVGAPQFKLLSGEGLTDYLFNKHVIHHLFCPVCGVTSYCTGKNKDGTPMYAVNVRCLDGVDVDTLKIIKHDGKNK